MEKSQVRNLCDSCVKSFGECNGCTIVWGYQVNPESTGADIDAVVECDNYTER